MSNRIAVDANAAIAWLRTEETDATAFRRAQSVAFPLPVVGELYAGAFASTNREANLERVASFLATGEIIKPDEETARVYGTLRARMRLTDIRASKMNDLWIAALCLQHSLPLLTNDRGFDPITGLTVIRW
ncbi:MAG TPA: PIN domain-containing protein [Thermoanaerobaculia bacterium]